MYLKNRKKKLIFLMISMITIFFYLDTESFIRISYIFESSEVEIYFQNLTGLLTNLNYYNGKKFVSSNSHCQIEELNIWDRSIWKLIRKIPKYDKCKKHSPLSYIKDSILFIDQNINKTFYHGKISRCLFAPVERNTTQNDNYKLGEYREIKEPILVIDEFIKVKCLINSSNVYEYVHAVIIDKKPAKESENKDDKLNVVILVFDAVSRSSFKRSLPGTLKYLQSFDNFFMFRKHNVVGSNTFQNIVPILCNLKSDALLNQTEKSKIVPPFDNFPFIWKNYSNE